MARFLLTTATVLLPACLLACLAAFVRARLHAARLPLPASGWWCTDRYIDDASRVSDAGITALAAVFTELEVFEVTHSNKVGDDGIATIAENCPKLRVLNLSYCNNIGNAALKVLGR